MVNLVDCDISSTSEEKGRSGEGAMDIAHVTNQTVQQITKQSKIERRKSRSESLVNSIHWIGQVPLLRSISKPGSIPATSMIESGRTEELSNDRVE